jgi:small subunit ribosomal protein S20
LTLAGHADISPPSVLRRSLGKDRIMANTVSAKKAIRKIERRTVINRNRRSRVRSFLRKVEDAIAKGDKGAAQAALREARPELARAAQKGAIHRNAAARKVSRLSRRVLALNG